MTYAHKFLDLSHFKRVLTCGDIHGEYEELDRVLETVGYDSKTDALICVGDLIDRGPNSEGFEEFIERENVYRVLGNHDLAPGMYLSGQLSSGEVSNWGGDWYRKLPKARIQEIAAKLEDVPFALTVLTPGKHKVGFVHADCYRDWDRHIALLEQNRLDVQDLSVWSRETIKSLLKNAENKVPFDPESIRVKNIDHVFHGHTVVGKACTLSNRSWIDTGMCFGYSMTVVDVDRTVETNILSDTLERGH